MCLIIIAPKGTDKYSSIIDEAITNGANTNDEGYGYAFKDSKTKKVYISKGFFDVEELKKSIKSKDIGKDDELIIHFRIGTSGNKNAMNCHPFVVSEDDYNIQICEGYLDLPVLAHNGVFYKYSNNNSLYSDTYHFTKEFIAVPEILQLLKRDEKLFDTIFSEKISTNKLVILFPDRDFIKIGTFIEDSGYLFSNYCYRNTSIRNVGGKTINNLHKQYNYGMYNQYGDYNDYELKDDTEFDPRPVKFEKTLNKTASIGKLILKGLPITEDNYDEIVLKPIETTTSFTKNEEYYIDLMFKDDQFVTICSKSSPLTNKNLQNINTIEDNFYIVPAKGFEEKYSSYNYLLNNFNISRNSLKKLRKALSNNFNKENFNFKNHSLNTSGAALFLKNNESKLEKVGNKKELNIVD